MKNHWSSIIDFLVSNLIIAVVLSCVGSIIEVLSSPYLPDYIDVPKSYAAFIEGAMAGVLIGVYVIFKKKINVLSMILGMWLYPLSKFALHKPVKNMESWLIYLSDISMFVGVFCMLFYLASMIKKRLGDGVSRP